MPREIPQVGRGKELLGVGGHHGDGTRRRAPGTLQGSPDHGHKRRSQPAKGSDSAEYTLDSTALTGAGEAGMASALVTRMRNLHLYRRAGTGQGNVFAGTYVTSLVV